MRAKVQIPNASEHPLLHAAATGDVKSLSRLAHSYTSSSSTAIAALRSDRNGVTALHYSAYYHQKSAAILLLNLACEKIRNGIQMEIDELIQKRTRFLEETKYSYNSAMNAIEDDKFYDDVDPEEDKAGGGDKASHSSAPAQIIEDAISFESWCSNELTRLIRTRELSCEAQWKKCLTAADKDGRTCLHYIACTNGGDEVAEAILTTGRARLSAIIPEFATVDVRSFIEHNIDLGSATESRRKGGKSSKGGKSGGNSR